MGEPWKKPTPIKEYIREVLTVKWEDWSIAGVGLILFIGLYVVGTINGWW